MGHDYLKSALSHQSFLAASHTRFCVVLSGSVLFFTWRLLPRRFVSRTSPSLFSSALALAVPDAVTSVASGPIRLPREVVKLLPGDAAVVTHSSQPRCPLQGLYLLAALPAFLVCSLFFSSFCQTTDSFAVLPSSRVHGPSVL